MAWEPMAWEPMAWEPMAWECVAWEPMAWEPKAVGARRDASTRRVAQPPNNNKATRHHVYYRVLTCFAVMLGRITNGDIVYMSIYQYTSIHISSNQRTLVYINCWTPAKPKDIITVSTLPMICVTCSWLNPAKAKQHNCWNLRKAKRHNNLLHIAHDSCHLFLAQHGKSKKT